MSPLRTAIVAGSVAAVITLGAHYRARQNALREVSRLRAENDSWRLEINQRRETMHLKEQNSGSGKRGGHSEGAGIGVPDSNDPGGVPVTEYRNEGRATPIAALQTMAWAIDYGDAGALEKLISFDDTAKEKAAAYWASLSQASRTQWGSLEGMAAALLISDGVHRPFPPAKVLEKATSEVVGKDRIRLRLPGTSREITQYQRTPDGWKFAITEAMVDAYLAHLPTPEVGAK